MENGLNSGGSGGREKCGNRMKMKKHKRWNFKSFGDPISGGAKGTVRGYLDKLMAQVDDDNGKTLIPLGHGDPSKFACFRTSPAAVEAIDSALRSAKFSGYWPSTDISSVRS